jgi:hypothetical protein
VPPKGAAVRLRQPFFERLAGRVGASLEARLSDTVEAAMERRYRF